MAEVNQDSSNVFLQLRIGQMSAIPCEQEVHTMHCSHGDVKRVRARSTRNDALRKERLGRLKRCIVSVEFVAVRCVKATASGWAIAQRSIKEFPMMK
jgi:hypothetical protein